MKALVLIVLTMLLVSFNGNAQPAGQPQNPPAVPITGIEYLLIGGGAYGIYRLIKKRNKKNNES